ncbi:MAG: hypothetical protein J07HQW2_03178 [Haloquadratum walsbyi J07HQW2]|uniref:Uncharacterized protein n=1 Tax=Haloquadratum walsbyi J07HQW2 TaxID=1238425 RepID=U1NHN1_9EURY|nr:MAG: hypothetical protein J07HQW2_03178 [Haloquadratum walsbyi J07HQW2]
MVGVAVVVLARGDALEPVGEQSRFVLGRATDEQVNVDVVGVGLYGEVEYFDAFVVGYFVEDGSDTTGDLVDEYRVAVLRQPHYVVVEVVGRVSCGLHPSYTLWGHRMLLLTVNRWEIQPWRRRRTCTLLSA